MGIYFAGVEYDAIHIAGVASRELEIGGAEYHAAVRDAAGVLTVNARRASRGANIGYSIADANGIRAVTAVIMLADDGTRSDVTSAITRSDANTFSGTSRRANNKWRVASITVTYVDATSGDSHTLTESWSL